jgi:hypothetical protein
VFCYAGQVLLLARRVHGERCLQPDRCCPLRAVSAKDPRIEMPPAGQVLPPARRVHGEPAKDPRV